MTKQVFPPTGGQGNGSHVINGVMYSCAAGSSITVPDDIANILSASGWSLVPGTVGTTATRPNYTIADKGKNFLDQTLGMPIHWDGKNWRNPLTNAIV